MSDCAANSSGATVKSSSPSSLGVGSPPEQVLSPASSHGPLIIRPINPPTSGESSRRPRAPARYSNSSEITGAAAETDHDPSLPADDPPPTVKTEIRAAVEGLTGSAMLSWESVKLDMGSSDSMTTITGPNSDWLESEGGDGHHIDVGARCEDQKEPEGNRRQTTCCALL
jgi:hypothetical protein